MHAELTSRFALVAVVFLEDGLQKPLLEFAHSFGIEDAAAIHLHNQGFQLVLHHRLTFVQAKMWSLMRRVFLLDAAECRYA